MLQGHTMAIVPCGNPTPKKTAYRWWRMAYFLHSARTAHGTPPLAQNLIETQQSGLLPPPPKGVVSPIKITLAPKRESPLPPLNDNHDQRFQVPKAQRYPAKTWN